MDLVAAEAQERRPVTDERALEELFSALTAGEAGALGALYDCCASELYGFALWRTRNRADAADVVQETFLRLLEGRGALSEVRSPKSYLFAMVHRAAVDVHRRRSREVDVDVALLESARGEGEHRAEAARLSALVGGLPEGQRDAVYLRCYAGLSFSEIGTVTGTSLFTAASRYRLGISRLRFLVGAEP